MQKEQLEAAALQEELDQNQADLEAIHKILSSPFVQRDAMREAGERRLQVLGDHHATVNTKAVTTGQQSARERCERVIRCFESEVHGVLQSLRNSRCRLHPRSMGRGSLSSSLLPAQRPQTRQLPGRYSSLRPKVCLLMRSAHMYQSAASGALIVGHPKACSCACRQSSNKAL